MAGSHIGQRHVAGEVDAPGLGDGEPSSSVTSWIGERNTDTTDSVDQPPEGAEVDLDVVVDRQTEVAVDRLDEAVWVVGFVGGVDAILATTGNVDVQIAWE